MNREAGRPAVGVTAEVAGIDDMALMVGGVGTMAELGGVPVAWHISTRSPDNGGNCVEAGPLGDGSGRVAVRHSKEPTGTVILYTRDEWEAFVAGVRNGEFDFFQG